MESQRDATCTPLAGGVSSNWLRKWSHHLLTCFAPVVCVLGVVLSLVRTEKVGHSVATLLSLVAALDQAALSGRNWNAPPWIPQTILFLRPVVVLLFQGVSSSYGPLSVLLGVSLLEMHQFSWAPSKLAAICGAFFGAQIVLLLVHGVPVASIMTVVATLSLFCALVIYMSTLNRASSEPRSRRPGSSPSTPRSGMTHRRSFSTKLVQGLADMELELDGEYSEAYAKLQKELFLEGSDLMRIMVQRKEEENMKGATFPDKLSVVTLQFNPHSSLGKLYKKWTTLRIKEWPNRVAKGLMLFMTGVTIVTAYVSTRHLARWGLTNYLAALPVVLIMVQYRRTLDDDYASMLGSALRVLLFDSLHYIIFPHLSPSLIPVAYPELQPSMLFAIWPVAVIFITDCLQYGMVSKSIEGALCECVNVFLHCVWFIFVFDRQGVADPSLLVCGDMLMLVYSIGAIIRLLSVVFLTDHTISVFLAENGYARKFSYVQNKWVMVRLHSIPFIETMNSMTLEFSDPRMEKSFCYYLYSSCGFSRTIVFEAFSVMMMMDLFISAFVPVSINEKLILALVYTSAVSCSKALAVLSRAHGSEDGPVNPLQEGIIHIFLFFYSVYVHLMYMISTSGVEYCAPYFGMHYNMWIALLNITPVLMLFGATWFSNLIQTLSTFIFVVGGSAVLFGHITVTPIPICSGLLGIHAAYFLEKDRRKAFCSESEVILGAWKSLSKLRPSLSNSKDGEFEVDVNTDHDDSPSTHLLRKRTSVGAVSEPE